MSLKLMVLTEKCIYLWICWWENNLLGCWWENKLVVDGLWQPGDVSKHSWSERSWVLFQMSWAPAAAVEPLQGCATKLWSARICEQQWSDHTESQLWGCDVPQEPSFIAGCSCQLAATKFLWFTTELCQFCKFVKAKQGRVGCETAGWKEKPLKTKFLYLMAAG